MTCIFVCGPMTGIENFNYPAFHDAAAKLRALGYTVLSPAENPVCETWAAYMRNSIAQVLRCDCVAVLDGWEHSRGAKIECELAWELHIPVRHVSELLDASDTLIAALTEGVAA